ncbi:MAG: ribbon-helix-helix domain-containing protein [Gammaproteobacteria bacterium]|nr:ribbon-helix-helix domain-containing protein [Gammaproteobacteria bacterium]
MSELSKRTTVYFDSFVYEALRTKAEYAHLSISELVDEAVRLLLSEYREDLSAFLEREKEPEINYEALLNDLKTHCKICQ